MLVAQRDGDGFGGTSRRGGTVEAHISDVRAIETAGNIIRFHPHEAGGRARRDGAQSKHIATPHLKSTPLIGSTCSFVFVGRNTFLLKVVTVFYTVKIDRSTTL